MSDIALNQEADSLRQMLTQGYARGDRLMAWLLTGLFLLSLAMAPWYQTWLAALLIGTPCLAGGWLWLKLAPGSLSTRMVMAASLMVFAALQIHQSRGMIEFHFSIFCLLGCLVYYRDWKPVVLAAALIAVHHVAVSLMQAAQLPVYAFPPGRYSLELVALHAAFVVAETIVLCLLMHRMRKEQQNIMSISVLLDDNSRKLEQLLDQSVSHTQSKTGQLDHLSRHLQMFNQLTQQLSDEAKRSSTLAHNSYQSAVEGSNIIIRSDREMEQVSSQLDLASTHVRELAQSSESVAAMVSTITDISYKTNLLALNASIEAARAGEHGRGFMVVAHEVRKLSELTNQVTQDILGMITQMRDNKATALNSMSLALASVKNSRTLSGQASSMVHGISGRARESAEQIRSMANDLAMQAQDCEKLDAQLVQLREQAQNSDQLISETFTAANSLSKVIQQSLS